MSDLNEDDEKYHFGTDLTSETTPGMASQLEPTSGDCSVYYCIIVCEADLYILMLYVS